MKELGPAIYKNAPTKTYIASVDSSRTASFGACFDGRQGKLGRINLSTFFTRSPFSPSGLDSIGDYTGGGFTWARSAGRRQSWNIKKSGWVGICRVGNGAVWKIEVEGFPAFVLVDDKGNDFSRQILH
jgi:hypothetical protein